MRFLGAMVIAAIWSQVLLAQTPLHAPTPFAQTPLIETTPVLHCPAPQQPPCTLWRFLGISHEQCAESRAHFSRTGLGQLTWSLFAPVRLLTGGVLGGQCPTGPTPSEVAKMNLACLSPAEQAALKIQAEEHGARDRRNAVRYLGNVNGMYYPEAEFGLVAALRCDRNECVRYEAAIALGKGGCCSRKVIEALSIAAAGSDRDGNPPEVSDRVRMAASNSLQRCVARSVGAAPGDLPEPPAVKDVKNSPIRQASYQEPIVEPELRKFAETAGAPQAAPTQSKHLWGLFQQARQTPAPASVGPARSNSPLRPIGGVAITGPVPPPAPPTQVVPPAILPASLSFEGAIPLPALLPPIDADPLESR